MHDFIPSIMLVWLIHVEVSLVTVIVCKKENEYKFMIK